MLTSIIHGIMLIILLDSTVIYQFEFYGLLYFEIYITQVERII